MTATELKRYQTRLVEMTRRLRSERTQLQSEVLGDERDPSVSTTQEQYTSDDLSRESWDEEVALSLLDNEEQMLIECLAALDRIERGVFGQCRHCGGKIATTRLEAVPYARDCIRCAREAETKFD